MSPTAKITKPASITHGTSASFSGSGSTDPFPGGVITSYTWTCGDGSSTTTGSSSTSHTYASAGTKTVTLKVTDNYGRTSAVVSTGVTVS